MYLYVLTRSIEKGCQRDIVFLSVSTVDISGFYSFHFPTWKSRTCRRDQKSAGRMNGWCTAFSLLPQLILAIITILFLAPLRESWDMRPTGLLNSSMGRICMYHLCQHHMENVRASCMAARAAMHITHAVGNTGSPTLHGHVFRPSFISIVYTASV